jgi:hypothetical protein
VRISIIFSKRSSEKTLENTCESHFEHSTSRERKVKAIPELCKQNHHAPNRGILSLRWLVRQPITMEIIIFLRSRPREQTPPDLLPTSPNSLPDRTNYFLLSRSSRISMSRYNMQETLQHTLGNPWEIHGKASLHRWVMQVEWGFKSLSIRLQDFLTPDMALDAIFRCDRFEHWL